MATRRTQSEALGCSGALITARLSAAQKKFARKDPAGRIQSHFSCRPAGFIPLHILLGVLQRIRKTLSVRHFVKKVRLAFGKLRSLPWSGIATEMRVDIGHAHFCMLQ